MHPERKSKREDDLLNCSIINAVSLVLSSRMWKPTAKSRFSIQMFLHSDKCVQNVFTCICLSVSACEVSLSVCGGLLLLKALSVLPISDMLSHIICGSSFTPLFGSCHQHSPCMSQTRWPSVLLIMTSYLHMETQLKLNSVEMKAYVTM